MREDLKTGSNAVISEEAAVGDHVRIGANCVIEDDVVIGDNAYIDSNSIIRRGTKLGAGSFVGANCVIGEYQTDFIMDRQPHRHELLIGDAAVIRSGTIIYTGSSIGRHFQTGHQVNIREKTEIGDHVSLGTLSDIQGECRIGDYVRAHSSVHIAQRAVIESFVWLFPYVVLTNDPMPPSETLAGVHVCPFAVIASRSVILPGKRIGQDALVGAGSVVTRDVGPYTLVSGNPAKKVSDVRQLNKIAGKEIYPWRNSFARGMPWSETRFDKWYQELSDEERKRYRLEELDL